MSEDEFSRFALDNRKIFDTERDRAYRRIRSALSANNVPHFSITTRIKEIDKVVEKASRKSYNHPIEMTDYLGVRITCYLEGQIDDVARVLRGLYSIDEVNCKDFREIENPATFGYRALHLICNSSRQIGGRPFRFEAQIRTLLQGAWAEVEHGLNYKSKQALPRDLQRSLYRLSAVLESVDDELFRLSRSAKVASQEMETREPERMQEPLSYQAVRALLRHYALTELNLKIDKLSQSSANTLLDELQLFGVHKTEQLADMLDRVEVHLVSMAMHHFKEKGKASLLGLGRSVMMLSDPHRYFQSTENRFSSLADGLANALNEKYPEVNLNQYVRAL